MRAKLEAELARLETEYAKQIEMRDSAAQQAFRFEGAIVTLRALLAKDVDEAHEAQPLPDGAELVEA